MAVDSLQTKIRKGKNAVMLDLAILPELLPANLLAESGDMLSAYGTFVRKLMAALKGTVTALRFSHGFMSLLGTKGLDLLAELMKEASSMGYYVLMDAPELLSADMAAFAADSILGKGSRYACDGVIISAYLGSDILKPFLPYCKDAKKDVFVMVRSGNKSASELQDLLTGSRQVNAAAADYVNRYSADTVGRSGYSRVGIAASAGSADSLRNLRAKYPKLFILVDGLDYPGANLKNASYAFDKLGHGAMVCAGTSITCAWKKAETDGADFAEQALAAAERIQKNLNRYITIL